MLLFSHDGVLTLLPALPEEWASGEITGFKARGNFIVDLKWEQGIPVQVLVTSNSGGVMKVRSPYSASAIVKSSIDAAVHITKEEADTVLVIPTTAGATYTITGFGKLRRDQ